MLGCFQVDAINRDNTFTYIGDHNQANRVETIEMHQVGSGHTNAGGEIQFTALIRSDISGLLPKGVEKNGQESSKSLLEEEDRIEGRYQIQLEY